MRLIHEERLTAFARAHPEAKSALLRWAAVTKVSRWRNLADVRNSFRSADRVCECTVFNVRGNNYRLITRIYHAEQTVTLYRFITHKEYGRGAWKRDCDPGLEEAVKSIIYAAPRTEIKELQQVRQLLVEKYGKEFAVTAIENSDGKVAERVPPSLPPSLLLPSRLMS